MIVLLFDIDGTLISTGGAGQAALDAAFTEIFQIERTVPVPISGRTDRSIASDLFRLHSVDDTPANWQRMRNAYLQHLPAQLRQRPGKSLPGIVPLLEHLAAKDNVVLGLLTGNVRDGAVIKLNHFALHHYFQFGGFGDECFDRNHVAEAALANAQLHLNGQLSLDRTWVIGDTPLDIRCARWIGARVCAVSTGTFSRDELAAGEPDVLLDDLSNVDQVLAHWLGN